MKAYQVLIADALLLALLFFVESDLQGRVAYAETVHGHTSGYIPSFSYSLFTQVFTMTGSGVSLSSPPTLDWIQVLGAVLIVLNCWYLYTVLAHNRKPAPPATPQ
ncbi:MAG: hypothetical protein JRM73_00690 [Nitrososphaerota archaeon]|nr:hypothetical protein [Nitrososphaerota archaeon]